MARVELSQKTWDAAVNNAKTRAALATKAGRIKARADSLAQAENVKLDSQVTSGRRPKGRSYARVSSPNVQQEWGGSNTARRRILGRAAESS
jgi:hypothetical protein